MNTIQSIYNSFVIKALTIVCAMVTVCGNVWAETMLEKEYTSGSVTIRGNAKTHETIGGIWGVTYDNLTISGNSTVVVVSGNLTINGKLTVSDGATVIVEGSLYQNANVEVKNATLIVSPHYDKKNNYDIWQADKIIREIKVTGTGLIAIMGDYSNGSSRVIDVKGADGSTNVYSETGVTLIGTSKYDNKQAYDKARNVIANNASLLPIELTSFSVEQNGSDIDIAWTTNSEVNNDYFTVEYSVDGVSFKTLETVAGSGTTSEVNEYAITTEVSRFNGLVYFRLKQTDYNGEYSYSDVITLAVESSNELYVYPNPATDFVSVSGAYKTATVQDMFGKKVAFATSGEQIYVGNLSAGMYYVVITTENGKKVLSFVKE